MLKDRIHLGTYRFDYADGDTARAHRFTPYSEFDDAQASQMNEIVKKVTEQFNSLSAIQDYCGGMFGSSEKLIPEAQHEEIIYSIKLNPCKGEYNGYIFFMLKKEE